MGLAVGGSEQEDAARRPHVVVARLQGALRVEAALEALRDLGVVAGDAAPGLGRVRIGRSDGDVGAVQRGGDEVHRGEDAVGAAPLRGQDAGGALVGAGIVARGLGAAGRGPGGAAAAAVLRAGGERDEALAGEPGEEAAEKPGVEVELLAELDEIAAGGADRAEHPGAAERAALAEVAGVERADLARDGAVEAADGGDRVGVHDP